MGEGGGGWEGGAQGGVRIGVDACLVLFLFLFVCDSMPVCILLRDLNRGRRGIEVHGSFVPLLCAVTDSGLEEIDR